MRLSLSRALLWITVAILVLALICLGFLLFWLLTDSPTPSETLPVDGETESSNQVGSQDPPPPPDPDLEIEGRYLFTGTVVTDRGIENASRLADGSLDFSHPFSALDSYQPEDYDAWVTDWECPISAVDLPPIRGWQDFEFNCLPGYLEQASQYFEFYNLANNHSDNSGPEKFQETLERLANSGGQYFGHPNPDVREAYCEVVALPVRLLNQTDETTQPAHLPVAFCAYHYYHRLPKPGEIETTSSYAEHLPVFGFVHMGAEYQAAADGVQQSIARKMIDAGASFVIGNNPHWVQNAELYKGKLIVYSTGNFIFDQDWSHEVSQSANIVVDLKVTFGDETDAWLALGPLCRDYGDDCLARIQQEKLARYDFKLSFDVVAGYVTLQAPQRVAPDDIQQAVRSRLGWDDLFPPRESPDNEI